MYNLRREEKSAWVNLAKKLRFQAGTLFWDVKRRSSGSLGDLKEHYKDTPNEGGTV